MVGLLHNEKYGEIDVFKVGDSEIITWTSQEGGDWFCMPWEIVFKKVKEMYYTGFWNSIWK